MSRDMDDLVVEARIKMREVHRLAAQEGCNLLQLETMRPPHQQARLYRQSRGRAEIVAKQAQLDKWGYPYLAQIIDQVGPQYGVLGAHVTYAAPGESFHQFGAASDACPWVGDPGNSLLAWDAMADPERASELWEIYGCCVRQSGLFWAGDWVGGSDRPHAQLYCQGNPLDVFSPEFIHDWASQNGWTVPTPTETEEVPGEQIDSQTSDGESA